VREERTELERDANKLKEEKPELTTKVELQLALRQVKLLILKGTRRKELKV